MNCVQILTVIFDIFCPLATGYILRKKGWMSQKACNALMLFNVVALITVMNLMSFWILPISRSFILLPILSVVMALLSVGLAVFVFGRSLSDPLEKGSFAVSAMLSNIGTLGGICAFIAYGEISFAYVQLFAVPQNVLMVILAFPLAQYYYAKKLESAAGLHWEISIKDMFFTKKQLGVLGMLIGLGLQLAGVERPPVVANFFHCLVHIQAWIAFTPVGYTIDFSKASKYYKKVLSILPLRFLIVPLVVYLIARPFIHDQRLLGTILIAAATPTAINSVITAQLFGLDVDLSVASFLETTVVYVLVAFPLFYLYISYGGQL